MVGNTSWKWVGGVVSIALLGAVLSGCGQNSAPDSTTTTPTNTTAPMDDNRDNGTTNGGMSGDNRNNTGMNNHPMPNEGMNSHRNPPGDRMPGGSGGGGMGNR